jgi:hypothetical protein
MLQIKRKKSAEKKIKDGIYTASLYSIREFPGKIVLGFKTDKGLIDLSLPINDSLPDILGQIGYIAGIREGEDVVLSALLGAKMRIIIEYSVISKIKK